MLYISPKIFYIIIYIMAAGDDNENPWLDHQLDHDGDDDNNDDEEEVDTARPQPGNASTTYHNGEQIEMHTIPREQSGLPDTSFDESIPLFNPDEFTHEADQQERIEIVKDIIKKKIPKC